MKFVLLAILLITAQSLASELHPECPEGEVWDEGMQMCMPAPKRNDLTFHYNQFVIFTDGSGPRGRQALSAPNMWSLTLGRKTSDRNRLVLNWMGSSDLWLVPKGGTPELLQTGEANADGEPYVDAQHPHNSPITGLTFSDIMTLGKEGEHKLTFFFAPRGDATAGPQEFLHRASSEGNPDAPLGHHLQDFFHVTSTVIGAKVSLNDGDLTIEGSTFSGLEPAPAEVNLDMHKPDSWGVRATKRVSDKVLVGGSFAKVRSAHRGEHEAHPEKEQFINAWVFTSAHFGRGDFYTSSIFGQMRNKEEDILLNSFLEEFVYQLGKHKFFGRVEVLQRTPEQLLIEVTDGQTGAKWVTAGTLGYERTIYSKGRGTIYLGASATKNHLPAEFRKDYGGNPYSGRAFLRFNFGGLHNH